MTSSGVRYAVATTVAIGPFGCIPGVICGHLARRQCRLDPQLDGDGLAVAGLIVGYVFVAIHLAVIALMVLIAGAGTGAEPFIYELFPE